MRKLIASINMTLDGYCNHTAVIADDELHENANRLFANADTAIFGRVTYELMEEGWPPLIESPSGNKPMDDFAVLIDNIDKVVFSRTLETVTWKNSRLSQRSPEDEVLYLKKQQGKDILVGSPSLIVALMKLNLIDEYQLSIQPIVLGSGLTLFKDIASRIDLKLTGTKTMKSGTVVHSYAPGK